MTIPAARGPIVLLLSQADGATHESGALLPRKKYIKYARKKILHKKNPMEASLRDSSEGVPELPAEKSFSDTIP